MTDNDDDFPPPPPLTRSTCLLCNVLNTENTPIFHSHCGPCKRSRQINCRLGQITYTYPNFCDSCRSRGFSSSEDTFEQNNSETEEDEDAFLSDISSEDSSSDSDDGTKTKTKTKRKSSKRKSSKRKSKRKSKSKKKIVKKKIGIKKKF